MTADDPFDGARRVLPDEPARPEQPDDGDFAWGAYDEPYPAGEHAEPKPEPTSPIATMCKTITGHGIDLSKTPPPRTWLLKDNSRGFLPQGICGVLGAAGGTGKSTLLIQLAVSIATGTPWLDRFTVANPGRVLVMMGEETLDEAYRRFFRACRMALWKGDQEQYDELLRQLEQNVTIAALAGVVSPLTERDSSGNIVETEHLDALMQVLSRDDWRLVCVDPYSRFSAEGSETDNTVATRCVQAFEKLLKAKGQPTVMVAHHSSKASVKDGESNLRGSSAIVDGFRWAITIDKLHGTMKTSQETVRGARLRLPKTNYTPDMNPIVLTQSQGSGTGGCYREATSDEREALEAPKKPENNGSTNSRSSRPPKQETPSVVIGKL